MDVATKSILLLQSIEDSIQRVQESTDDLKIISFAQQCSKLSSSLILAFQQFFDLQFHSISAIIFKSFVLCLSFTATIDKANHLTFQHFFYLWMVHQMVFMRYQLNFELQSRNFGHWLRETFSFQQSVDLFLPPLRTARLQFN